MCVVVVARPCVLSSLGCVSLSLGVCVAVDVGRCAEPQQELPTTDLGSAVRGDEIKGNKNHIKEYYRLTAISLQLPVSF